MTLRLLTRTVAAAALSAALGLMGAAGALATCSPHTANYPETGDSMSFPSSHTLTASWSASG